MKIGSRILIGIGCAALLLVSWIVAITAPTDGERQLSLINQAAALMEDKIYITAVPLLEEAVDYQCSSSEKALVRISASSSR